MRKRQKAMLYGAGVPDKETMKTAPQVGIASVWWEGNPCKYRHRLTRAIHAVLEFGQIVKRAVEKQGML
ncbi:hypothetical protein M440DRAFT_1323197, partial [Trichoderma longibrachiatum ATCC 18648]